MLPSGSKLRCRQDTCLSGQDHEVLEEKDEVRPGYVGASFQAGKAINRSRRKERKVVKEVGQNPKMKGKNCWMLKSNNK